ncbi:MAG TPA: uroporphyrinogen decarboxylase [Acidocella sp.]|nr:uroporphyrinogen decarboxylase [Acidocella sp.]
MKLLNVLHGEPVWPPPVWLMRQAGRYLPEYRALREQAGEFLSLCLNPAFATEVTLQPIRRYGFDAAILFSDILILPMALGQCLNFAQGEGPVLPPLQDIASLDPSAAPARYAPVMETVRRVRAALPGDKALIGFAGGPATVACYMLDGKGGGFPRTRSLAYENPGFVTAVLDILTEATIAYLQEQLDAGANCVMLFESWAGIFPPEQFRKFVIGPTRRIVTSLKSTNPGVKIIGFPRLSGLLIGEYARETGVDAVGLDTVTDLPQAVAACPENTVFQGNLDPLPLKIGGTALDEAVLRLLSQCRGRPHIFNLGHGITPDVPPENVERLMNLIRNASTAR